MNYNKTKNNSIYKDNLIRKDNAIGENVKPIIAILKLSILFIILVGIPCYLFFFRQDLINTFNSIEKVELFLNKHEKESVIIYIGIQIIQILICFIPGQAVQIAAGYVFGFFRGYLYSIIGTVIGTLITFYISRSFGRPALYIFFNKEKIEKHIQNMNSKKAIWVVFTIFLIPGLPKDLFTYASGVSEMKFRTFLLISILARSPAMMISLGLGRLIEQMF